MPLDNKIHLLKLKPNSAFTVCGKELMCFYPMSETALLSEAGTDPIRVKSTKDGVTCELCNPTSTIATFNDWREEQEE